jgi:tRNA A37 methylthiotransferase MiaB
MDRIARKLPGGAIRTTFIVGYPGETEQDHQELLSFIREGRFTHAGCFLYSTEPLTPASKLAETVPMAVKKARRESLMLAQQEVSRRRTAARIGQTVELMVDAALAESPVKGAKQLCRSRLEAPEVDGMVFLKGKGTAQLVPGDFVQAEIVEAMEYDLVAELK